MRKPIALHFAFMAVLAAIPCGAQDAGGTAIKVSGNGRYFVDGGGKPFFWQGDTEWELFHFFPVSDAEGLFRKRRDQGFNVIQVMVKPPLDLGASGMKAGELMEAWLNGNPLTPSEDYFKRADAIVAMAEKYGIVLVLGVYHAVDVDRDRIDIQSEKAWAKWLAHRYRNSRNIVWSMYPHGVEESEPMIRAVMQGLWEGDGGAHLITLHPDPAPYPPGFMHSEPGLSFSTLQTGSTNLSHNYWEVTGDYKRSPVRPVVDGESSYESEDGTSSLETRRVGYWVCLAGGFYSYGHRDNWVAPRTWRNFTDSPGAAQMKVLGGIFRSIEWWKLVPDQSIIVNAGRGGDVAARSSDGDWILAYLPINAPITLRLDGITAAASAACWWIDPLTGARTRIGVSPTSETRTFAPPGSWQDAVLFLEKEPK